MLLIKAFHIIALVAWFAGLFYLPRLFVYHADTQDAISIERFKIMEKRLYYAITWPAALITSTLGFWLVSYNLSYYLHAGWMHAITCRLDACKIYFDSYFMGLPFIVWVLSKTVR